MDIVVDNDLLRQETQDLVNWLIHGLLQPPDFDWMAMSISITSSRQGAWGIRGYYYDYSGLWVPAKIKHLRYGSHPHQNDRLITSNWAQAVRDRVTPWQAALMYVLRDGNGLRISIKFDQALERWSPSAYETDLADMIRPPGLPVPPGPNTRRPVAPPEPARRGPGQILH